MKQQILKDVGGDLKVLVYSLNRPVIPTSATITIYKPGSDTELVSTTAASVDSTTGEISYSLSAGNSATNDLNYKIKWAYVYNSVTYYHVQLFDIVKSILAIPVVDEDLYNELNALREARYQRQGTATSATSSTLVDTASRKEPDDFWKGGSIEIISGTGINQVRDISSTTQSTATINVSPVWTTTPDTTSVYKITRSFSKNIEQAFEKLSTMIYNKGKRHQLILESSQIKVPLIYLAIHFICIDLMSGSDDVWSVRANMYWERFNEMFNGMKLDYDVDDSGGIAGEDEEQSNQTGIWMGRS